jgi:ribonuclease H2 subunit A
VVGMMTYGAAFWNRSEADKIPKGFNDSKQLSEETRSKLMRKILHDTPEMGFCLRVFHGSEISRNMLRSEPYNLNQMSHDAAIAMIRQLLEAGVGIETCYIDTVGIAEHYKRRLESEFSGRNINFVVESKADAKYAPCSAASVGTLVV